MSLVVFAPASEIGEQRVPAVKGRERQPIIAVWRENWGIATGTEFGPFLIFSIWEDGTVLWSKDNLKGGAPYYEGKVEVGVLENALNEIEKKETFSAPWAEKGNFGPDSSFLGILIVKGRKVFLSRSWHELYETNPDVVCMSYGLTPLNGARREDILKKDDKDYLKFRALWADLRGKIAMLVPKSGKQVDITIGTERLKVPSIGDGKKSPSQDRAK